MEYEDYIIEFTYNLTELRTRFPNIKFYPITNQILSVSIPQNEVDTFIEFLGPINSIYTPFILSLKLFDSLQASGISSLHNEALADLRGNGVLIGFIDTGIDYTHPAFRHADGTTRIQRIWDQTQEGIPPNLFNFGSEYTSEQINLALNSQNPFEVVPSQDFIGHGTALAGVAAGYSNDLNNKYTGAAPDSELVIVKLKEASDNLTNRLYLSPSIPAYQANDLMLGISYLVSLSTQLLRPLVICVGMGTNFGGHDGTSVFERYLDSLSTLEGIVIVVATGNEAIASHHTSKIIATNQTYPMELQVAEGEKNFPLEIWAGVADRISVSIKSPLGQIIDRIPFVPYHESSFSFSLEKTKVIITYIYPELKSGNEVVNIAFSNPTPGIWTINIHGDYIIDGEFDAWIPVTGFIMPDTKFLSPTPSTTLTVPSTGKHIISVGGYDSTTDSIYAHSGRGPTKSSIIKPDIVAPCVNIVTPTPSDSYITTEGTSLAAAITAGSYALLLQWGLLNRNFPRINTRSARTILIRGALQTLNINYPNPTEGYGKLNLINSINLV